MQETYNLIEAQIAQTKVITVIAIGVFAVITLLVGYFVSKSVVKPINILIQNAEKIAKGEEIEIKEKRTKAKPKRNGKTKKANRNYITSYDRWNYCI